jgi:hypothetical protein
VLAAAMQARVSSPRESDLNERRIMIVAVSWDAGIEACVDWEMEGFRSGEFIPPPHQQAIGRKKGRIDTGTHESTRGGAETAAIPGAGRDGRPAAMPGCHASAQRLARTIARMPARTAGGRLDHASTT